jgi:cell filamentation protein
MKDPYVYPDPDSNVLINLKDIHDQQKLDNFENALSTLALEDLLKNPIPITSCFDLLTIHKRIFGEIYPFAGSIRSIDIVKNEPVLGGLSINYSPHESIEKELRDLSVSLDTVDWAKIKKHQLASDIAFYLAALWKIHPFREGNTRSCTVFMLLFLKQKHIKLNENFLAKHAKYYRNALVLYSVDEAPEKQHLEQILEDAVSAKIITEKDEEKYTTLKQYKIDNYRYGYHHAKDEKK